MRRILRQHASWAICLALALGLAQVAAGETYEVTVENMIPGGLETGQPMTPPVVVVHNAGFQLFGAGAFATGGLEMLAEDGVTDDLVAEAKADANVYHIAVGGGPFFDTMVVEIEGNPGDLISVVTMLARSNDLITGIHDVVLPATDEVVFDPTGVYDAGTEQNTGLVEHIPFYGNAFVGPDENNPISMIEAYTVMDDPDHGMIAYTFPPSGRITIRIVDPTPTEDTTWGEMRALYR